jgi:hypothetical protein
MGCITRTERENSWEAETVDQTASKLSRELQQTATGKLALRPNIVNKSTKVPCHSQKLFSSARQGYSHPIALQYLAFRLFTQQVLKSSKTQNRSREWLGIAGKFMQKMENGRFGDGNADGNHFEMLTIHCDVILSQCLLFMMPK